MSFADRSSLTMRSYDSPPRGEATGEDKAFIETETAANGAIIAGRSTYEAAGRWGDANPFGVPLFIVTHRPDEQPDSGEVSIAGSLAEAVERASAAAGGKRVHLMGGADLIRQGLGAGYIDELTVIVAPVVLGGGKRLFDGFTQSLDLEHLGVTQSPYATFIRYRVRQSG
jgi:dihydrofolate reductase